MAKKKLKTKKITKKQYFIHKSAVIEDDVRIGDGTKIWHLSQIRKGAKLGENCILGKNVFIDHDVEIGSNVKIQNNCSIFYRAFIEDGVFVGPHVCFTNDKNPRALNKTGTLQLAEDWHVSTIRVHKGATIGAGSVILPDIDIGEFALAGSGSVITKDIPPFGLVFGNPARLRGFVCLCGKKIGQFLESDEAIVGKCVCGLNVPIDREAYRALQKQSEEPKRRIWLR